MVSVRFLLCVTLAASLFATVAAKSASASHILVKDEAKVGLNSSSTHLWLLVSRSLALPSHLSLLACRSSSLGLHLSLLIFSSPLQRCLRSSSRPLESIPSSQSLRN